MGAIVDNRRCSARLMRSSLWAIAGEGALWVGLQLAKCDDGELSELESGAYKGQTIAM